MYGPPSVRGAAGMHPGQQIHGPPLPLPTPPPPRPPPPLPSMGRMSDISDQRLSDGSHTVVRFTHTTRAISELMKGGGLGVGRGCGGGGAAGRVGGRGGRGGLVSGGLTSQNRPSQRVGVVVDRWQWLRALCTSKLSA